MLFRVKNDQKHFDQIRIKKPIRVVLGNSGVTADTSALRGITEKQKENDPELFWRRLKTITEQAYEVKKGIEAGDLEKVGETLTKNHEILIEMGLSHEKLIFLCNLAIKEGALGAKLTGGGMGGYMLALTPGKGLQETVASALEKEGSAVIRAVIGGN
jgi:mevalonate kinase